MREEVGKLLERLGDLPGLVERHAGLEGGKAAGLQRALHAVVEGLAEQRLAGPDRIGPVGDDEIEAALLALRPRYSKASATSILSRLSLKALALISPKCLRQSSTTSAVDVHQHDFLDLLVLKRLVGDGEIAAADDHHALGLAVLQQRQMRQHFGIGALVAGGDLDDVVERHDAPVGHRVEDFDALVLAFLIGERLGRQLHNLRVTFVEAFFDGSSPSQNLSEYDSAEDAKRRRS